MSKKINNVKKCHLYLESDVYVELTRIAIITHRNRSYIVLHLIKMFFDLPQKERSVPVFVKHCSDERYFDSNVISTLISFPKTFYEFLKREFGKFLIYHSFSELINGICKKMLIYSSELINVLNYSKICKDDFWDFNYCNYLKILKDAL